MRQQKGFISIPLIIGMVVVIGVVGYLVIHQGLFYPTSVPPVTETPDGADPKNIFCTKDARRCPDGSVVGRIPPKCDFIPCPTGSGDFGNSDCALENCHGLDIKCGPNPPAVCTAIYMMGDRCLQYAECGLQNDKCQQINNSQFIQCKFCVQKCIDANKNEAMNSLECERQCN